MSTWIFTWNYLFGKSGCAAPQYWLALGIIERSRWVDVSGADGHGQTKYQTIHRFWPFHGEPVRKGVWFPLGGKLRGRGKSNWWKIGLSTAHWISQRSLRSQCTVSGGFLMGSRCANSPVKVPLFHHSDIICDIVKFSLPQEEYHNITITFHMRPIFESSESILFQLLSLKLWSQPGALRLACQPIQCCFNIHHCFM